MPKRPRNHVDGVLLVDKPADWTSFDVVNCVRRHFDLDKVGHCGTLDPFATGLLVILLGKATRLQDALMAKDKVYTGTLKLGVETDTEDLTGNIIAEAPLPAEITEAQLQAIADSFLGDGEQIPPMHSAIKIDGKPLYKLAHKGETIERKPRPVRIDKFQLTAFRLPEADFEVHCSKGTYIRTLGADFGRRVGCGAHLTALRRQASGSHRVDQALALETLRGWTLEQLSTYLSDHAAEL